MNDTENAEHEPTEQKGVPLWIVNDPAWDPTHLVFEDQDGDRFRVPREEITTVPKKPKDMPEQPPIGYGVAFPDYCTVWRASDGRWYPTGKDPGKSLEEGYVPQEWEQVWEEHGLDGWKILMPISYEQLPFMMPREGPIDEIVIPDLSTGEPMPGLVAFVDKQECYRLRIRNVQDDNEIKLHAQDVLGIFAMYMRTQYASTREIFYGASKGDGEVNITLGE